MKGSSHALTINHVESDTGGPGVGRGAAVVSALVSPHVFQREGGLEVVVVLPRRPRGQRDQAEVHVAAARAGGGHQPGRVVVPSYRVKKTCTFQCFSSFQSAIYDTLLHSIVRVPTEI